MILSYVGHKNIYKLEIRSVERIICPIATLYSRAVVWPALVGLQLLLWRSGTRKAIVQLVQRRCLQLWCQRSASVRICLPYLTLPPGWTGSYTCPALRPYQLAPMRVPECNHKVTGSGIKP